MFSNRIDIKEVDLVVQIGPPSNTDTYVHRSGRTGRAGREGTSLVIFRHYEKRDLFYIEKELGHEFRFEVLDPPSDNDLIALETETALNKLKAVPGSAVDKYREGAENLLATSPDHVEVVARCLAAMNSRPTIVSSGSGRRDQGRNQNAGRGGGPRQHRTFNGRSGGEYGRGHSSSHGRNVHRGRPFNDRNRFHTNRRGSGFHH